MAFANVEPLPGRKADIRTGLEVLATAKAAGAKSISLLHCIPDWDHEPDVEQTPEEMNHQMAKVSAMFHAQTTT